jgi:rhamnose utilization protein RhaD (predicted bifunctional aldolase and dehydrogenase)
MADDNLNPLIEMTRTIGQPHLDYVIIGEGNSSCRLDDDTFCIKASGQGMHNIGADGFVSLRLEPILAMLEKPLGDLEAQKAVMQAAKVDPAARLPSVEVTFHAALLVECDVQYIGHTHPVAVNRILCSSRAQQFATNRMFPDEIVLCGPESVFVPYVDPGLPLGIAIRNGARDYIQRQGEAPKVILLANHGLIALGQTPTEILNITAMCVKAAHIFAGACAVGEPVFLSRDEIYHIYKRPDEIYRRARFVTGR